MVVWNDKLSTEQVGRRLQAPKTNLKCLASQVLSLKAGNMYQGQGTWYETLPLLLHLIMIGEAYGARDTHQRFPCLGCFLRSDGVAELLCTHARAQKQGGKQRLMLIRQVPFSWCVPNSGCRVNGDATRAKKSRGSSKTTQFGVLLDNWVRKVHDLSLLHSARESE